MADATPTDAPSADPLDLPDPLVLLDPREACWAELHHRTRNLLALVGSIARRTLASSTSLEDFGPRFEARLHALGRAQSFLAKADREGIDLAELVGGELAAHGGLGRAHVEGPSVILPRAAVQPLALAFHELAANAARHGALSQPKGELAVTWDVEEGRAGNGDGTERGSEAGEAKRGAGRRVRLAWREGGVVMPTGGGQPRRGLGREVIEGALPHQLRAATRLEFGSDGVRCEVVFDAEDGVESSGGQTQHG